MKNRVSFSKPPWAESYRPYLQIYFLSESKTKIKQLAIVDTGADRSLIGYQMGLQLGLEVSLEEIRAEEKREKSNAQGIGGSRNALNKETKIIIIDQDSGKEYEFITPVTWVIPTEREFNLLKKLEKERTALKMAKQSQPTSKHLKDMFNNKHQEYTKLHDSLEVPILIGREFMGNFKYINFVVNKEDGAKSYFEYEL